MSDGRNWNAARVLILGLVLTMMLWFVHHVHWFVGLCALLMAFLTGMDFSEVRNEDLE